jgi:hypothetical protein
LYAHMNNKTIKKKTKPLAVALSGARMRPSRGDGGGDLTNVQCMSIWNCHSVSPPHTVNM